ncbi:cell division protein FtsQ/DivIB [Marinicellulosiphila megalodicopiae]|uniref:cell division protein FtsQ/DivIB n=1 Tax=Marinicellulosiphila megalodicopiae TaxID=2724896 RepID=UPI003BB16BD5
MIIFFVCLSVFFIKKQDWLLIKTVNLPNDGQFKCQDFVELELLAQTAINKDFIDFEISEFHKKIENLDWIKSADIQFFWPNVLEISVEEYKPIAVWNNRYLLNEQAQILPQSCNMIPGVELIGPEVGLNDPKTENEKVSNIMNRYRQLAVQFSFFNMGISRLEYKKYGSWEITLDSNLIIKMSDTHFNLEFERLLVWLNSNHHKLIDIYKIDTRYQHGLIVGKKPVGANDES